jgi:phage repressor protein C with HTH and peptisase S24 domain
MIDGYKILEIRELYNLNQAEFAREIGYSREVINKIESGKMKPSKWLAVAVQKFIDEHQKPDFSQDVNILGKASHLPKKQHEPYVQQRREQKTISSEFLVPLVGIKAQAGYVKGYEQTDFIDTLDKYSLPPGVNPAGAIWRYFEIDGDSMEPSFNSGDLVLATMVPYEDWPDLKNFCVYVIHTNDQLLIKRIYKKSNTEWVLISDNEEAYPQVLIKPEDVKQLWLFRRHIRSKVPQPKEFKIAI